MAAFIEGLVRALREGDDGAQVAAARALGHLASNCYDKQVLISCAGGIAPLVQLLGVGSAEAKEHAAWALGHLAWNDANRVLIAEAGGIPLLVQLLRDGSWDAKAAAARALHFLARNDDANAVAIAAAVSLEALVQLARDGRVTVENRTVVRRNPAKRKAALVVAALLGDCVPDSMPREIKAVIGPYL